MSQDYFIHCKRCLYTFHDYFRNGSKIFFVNLWKRVVEFRMKKVVEFCMYRIKVLWDEISRLGLHCTSFQYSHTQRDSLIHLYDIVIILVFRCFLGTKFHSWIFMTCNKCHMFVFVHRGIRLSFEHHYG